VVISPYHRLLWSHKSRGSGSGRRTVRQLLLQVKKLKVSFKDSGLVLHPKYPYLGASPDVIGNCSCCGEVCVVIKCPFCKRDAKLETSLDKKDCLEKQDGKLILKITHPYYYQVQCQLLVCEKEFCDFIVWTEVDVHAERIGVDSELCSKILNKSKLFFLNAILPELVGKLFSKPSLEMSVTTDNANTIDMTATACAPSTKMQLMEASVRNVANEDTLNDCRCTTNYLFLSDGV